MSALRRNLRPMMYVALATVAFWGLLLGLVYSQTVIHDYRWPGVRPQLEAILPAMDPLLVALESYERDHGRYPDDVQRLVPSYLPAIPHLPPPMPQDFYYHVVDDGLRQRYEIRTHLEGRYNPWPRLTFIFTILCYRSDELYPDGLHHEKLIGHVGRRAYYTD